MQDSDPGPGDSESESESVPGPALPGPAGAVNTAGTYHYDPPAPR